MDLITVEVAYALPDRQHLQAVQLPRGSSLLQAVRRSGLLQRCPELARDTLMLGVFGRRCSPDTLAADGDRVEIYRPLLADPKTRRRRRAKEASRRR